MQNTAVQIHIDLSKQLLLLLNHQSEIIFDCLISSALLGTGCHRGSLQTPLGKHIIRAKIGAGVPMNGVFTGRRFTGEIYQQQMAQQYPQRDWILTRILWLSGLEPGKNRFGAVDTMARYIYIHGCPDDQPVGKPVSHGCIRMHNADILYLFRQVQPGTKVMIRTGTPT